MAGPDCQPPVLHALRFDKLWSDFQSSPLNFEDIVSVRDRSVSFVEFRNQLSTTRTDALADAATFNDDVNAILKRLEEYLACLAYLRQHETRLSPDGKPANVAASWRSALAPRSLFGGQQTIGTGSLDAELAMMLVRLVAVQWQLAQDSVERLAQISVVSEQTAVAGEVILRLRQAAGVLDFLADDLLVSVMDAHKPEEWSRSAPEAQPWLARVLRAVLLGQAQLVMAHAAHCKPYGAKVAATIYFGAGHVFEGAAQSLRKALVDQEEPAGGLGELKKYIALQATLSVTEGLLCQAEPMISTHDEVVRGCSLAQLAVEKAASCVYVADGVPAWNAVCRSLQAAAAKLSQLADTRRQTVYGLLPDKQPPPDVPGGRALVAPLPFLLPVAEVDLEFD